MGVNVQDRKVAAAQKGDVADPKDADVADSATDSEEEPASQGDKWISSFQVR